MRTYALPILAVWLALLSATTVYSGPCDGIKVIAHRGLSGRAPEESELSYLLAADLKADYIEMDVQRTKDGVLILNHDEQFLRTTNVQSVYPSRAENSINSFEWSEVERLLTGAAFNKKKTHFANLKFINSHIETLEEVIDLALSHPNHPGLYIESKNPNSYPGLEKDIVELLDRKYAFARLHVIFQSFDQQSLLTFQKLTQDVPIIYLSKAKTYSRLIRTDLKFARAHHFGIGPKFKTVGKTRLDAFLKLAHAQNTFVHFYTIDAQESLGELVQAKADGIFTNRADLLQRECKRATSRESEATISARLDLL